MIKLKKLGLTALGTLAITTPIATVVSCGKDNESSSSHATIIESVHPHNEGPSTHIAQLKSVGVNVSKEDGFSGAFKLSSTNGVNNALIKNGKIASWSDIKNANFSPKISLNITLSNALKNQIMDKYKKAKQESISFNNRYDGYELSLDIESGRIIEEAFFQNDINSKGDAQKISHKIKELEKMHTTKISFNLELPNWLREMKNIWINIQGPSFFSTSVDAPDFATAQIENIEPNGNQIKSLRLNNLGLTTFDSRNLPKELEELSLFGNKITTFDSRNLPKALKKLSLFGNKLTTFDSRNLPKGITKIDLGNNKLTTFDLLQLPLWTKELDLSYNQITTFDTTDLPEGITKINLDSNELTTFDATKLPKGVTTLRLYDNHLSTFDISKLPTGLKVLVLDQNNLATDVVQKIDAWKTSHNVK